MSEAQHCQEKVTYDLDLHGKRIEHIEGLEEFQSLRILDLSCNSIQRISGLTCNKELCELKLYGNGIEVIEGLEKLPKLCGLLLQHNKLAGIGRGLCGLHRLRVLRLDHNKLRSVGGGELTPCPLLTSLDLSHNRLAVVEGLGSLPVLEELRLSHNCLTAPPNLTRCKRLLELDISRNPISSSFLAGLKCLQQLKILRVEGLGIAEVAVLPSLRCLEELHTADNQLKTLQGVGHWFPSIEVMDVRRNFLSTFEVLQPLRALALLSELLLEGNPLSTLQSYRSEVRTQLPQVEVLDSVSLSAGEVVRGAVPLLRPATPSSLGPSLRQMERQLTQTERELENYHSKLSASFELLQSEVAAHTSQPHTDAGGCLTDHQVAVTQSLGPQPPPSPYTLSTSSRPVSRCSSRARLEEALAFASEHFDT